MISLYDIDGAEPVFVWTGAPEAFLADNDGNPDVEAAVAECIAHGTATFNGGAGGRWLITRSA